MRSRAHQSLPLSATAAAAAVFMFSVQVQAQQAAAEPAKQDEKAKATTSAQAPAPRPIMLAQAAPAPAGSAGAPAPQTITVTGIRKGIEDAISVKKNADSIVEAVSAEDIGKLPDTSVAESLSRLPGVTVQRSSVTGRAQGVSVRGMSPDFNGALLNGREQASTAANRGVEFDQFPSELLSTLVVYKTPDAALLGQGLSSTINQLTVRPLDFAKRTGGVSYRRERTTAAENQPGFGSGKGDRFSLSYIDQFADRTVGVALGFSRYDAKGGGRPNFNTWGGWVADVDYNGTTVKVPGGFTTDVETINSKRDGVMATLQFRPNKNFESVLDVFYSKGDFSLQKRGLEGPVGGLSAGANDTGGTITTATVVDGVATSGTINNYRGVIRNHNEDYTDSLKSIGWNNKFKVADWTIGTDLSRSQVVKKAVRFETTAGLPGNSATNAADTISWSGFNGSNLDQVRYTTGLNYADPNLVRLTDVQGWAGSNGVQDGYYANPVNNDTISAGRLSFKKPVSLGPLTEVDFGANLTNRNKTRVTREGALILPGALNADGTVANRFANVAVPGGTPGVGGLSGIPVLQWDPADSLGSVYSLNPWSDPDIAAKSWGVKEKVTTAYLKGDLDGSLGGLAYRGNVGVQLVNTKQTSSGASVDRATCDGGTHTCTYVPLSQSASYTEALPSVNLNFALGGDSMLRLGLGRQLSRVDMDDLRPSVDLSINTTTGRLQASGGNPNLKPFLATALDISYEKYFGKSGYVSGAVFYKDLSTYVYKVGQATDLAPYLLPSTTVPVDGTGAPVTTGFLTVPRNGNGGSIQGVELAVNVPFSLLTPAMNGFGAMFNVSYTDSSISIPTSGLDTTGVGTANIPLPGLSKLVTNLRVYYEAHGFQVGLARRERSAYLGAITDYQDNLQLTYIKAETVYDLQASYEVQTGAAKGLSLLAQANNLTNTPQVRYDEATGQVTERKKFGRQFMVGLSYKF